jgi:hypothetical protein
MAKSTELGFYVVSLPLAPCKVGALVEGQPGPKWSNCVASVVTSWWATIVESVEAKGSALVKTLRSYKFSFSISLLCCAVAWVGRQEAWRGKGSSSNKLN